MVLGSKVFLACLPVGMSIRSQRRKQSRNPWSGLSLDNMMDLDAQLGVLDDLQNVGKRFITELAVNGSRDRAEGYDASAEYIMQHIKSLSPELKPVQEFYDDLMWRNTKAPTLSVGIENFEFDTDFKIMTFSGSGVSMGVPHAPSDPRGCNPEDWEGFPAGKPASVARGDCSFCIKAYNAQKAGASALLLYFLEGQRLSAPRLKCDWGTSDLPAFSTTFEVGQKLAAGSVHASSFGENIYKKSSNVILDFPSGDPNFVVVLGAHLDSVPGTPGINDNGSGCALIMEVLRNAVRKYLNGGMKNGLRFCWFGSEEWGLIGSRKYVGALTQDQNSKIAGMLNFDMMASSNGGYFINKGSMDPVTPAASGHIQRLWENAFDSYSLPWEWSGLGGSDYVSFLEKGIPAGGINAGASSLKSQAMADRFGGVAGAPYAPCYHRPCDTWQQFDRPRMLFMSKAAAQVTEKLVLDPQLHVNLAREGAGLGVQTIPATAEGVHDVEAKDDEGLELS